MAGDWIKFELTTLDKPEVCQIADLADIDPDAVVGKLMRVWGWFDQQTEKGNAPSVSKKLLDRAVGVSGFCEHMKSVGWMEEAGGVINLPHFDRHNGKTAKNRLLTAKRVANHKSTNAKGNAPIVSDALPKEDVDVDVEKNQDQHHSLNTREEVPGFGGARAEEYEGLDHPVDPEPLEGELLDPETEASPEPVDPKAPVEMTLDWTPDAKLLKTYSVHFGVPVEAFTPEAIAPFTAHHESNGSLNTQSKWVSLLAKWVRDDKNKASNVRQFVKRESPSRHTGFDQRDYKAGLTARGDGTYDF